MKKRQNLKIVGTQRAQGPDETVLEMKQAFATALILLQGIPPGVHTWVSDDDHIPRSAALPIKWVIVYGSKLVGAMGNDAFYHWLEQFLHATTSQKAAMWENEGQWS